MPLGLFLGLLLALAAFSSALLEGFHARPPARSGSRNFVPSCARRGGAGERDGSARMPAQGKAPRPRDLDCKAATWWVGTDSRISAPDARSTAPARVSPPATRAMWRSRAGKRGGRLASALSAARATSARERVTKGPAEPPDARTTRTPFLLLDRLCFRAGPARTATRGNRPCGGAGLAGDRAARGRPR